MRLPPGISVQTVATWAQLSVPTVRLVLAGHPGPSETTRRRVAAALAHLAPAAEARLRKPGDHFHKTLGPAAGSVVVLLKTRGPQTAADLGKAIGVTAEAARQQLVRLAAEGLVVATAEPRGVGRPAQVWGLTEAGNGRFPDAHTALTAQLIGAIRTQLGEDVLDRLIDARAAKSKAACTAALEGAADLGERVARLAEARTREGYMAQSQPEGEGYVLVENHCPICVAATACQGFCRAELDTFREVLGPDVSVERTEHIVQGNRRCAYRIALQCVPPEEPKRRTGRRGKPG